MILFRADGNSTIGSGHIMRCLSIADALRDRGKECIFVTAGSEMEDRIRSIGFETRVLGTDYRQMEDELPAMLGILRELVPETLIVDSYYVTSAYFRAIPQDVRTVYIDDLATCAFPTDIVLNYNLFAAEETYRELYKRFDVRCPTLLLGSRYAPLRKEFHNCEARELKERIENVLVLTGGADPGHVALRYLRHLVRSPLQHRFCFHFVLGAMNSDVKEIRNLASGCENIEIHENVSQMYALMSQCDVAISASGSTLYELCACGVPIIAYVLADNQIELARAFQNRGAALFAGDVRENPAFPEAFDRFLEQLDENSELRRRISQAACRLVDGNGAVRIAEVLYK